MQKNVQKPVQNGYTSPTDPALAILQDQATQQRDLALQDDVVALNAKHAMMYGSRMALGNGGGFASWTGLPGATGLAG